MSPLNLSVGPAGFSGTENVQKALEVVKAAGLVELDTAEMYGNSEADLGAVGAAEQGFAISTKNPGGWSPGSLAALREKTEASLARLKVDQVDILYVHGPDASVPPGDYAHTFDALHREGRFRRFGISNYTPQQVSELHAYCTDNGLVPPTVYQGNYNAVSRKIDTTLLPLLKKLGIAFYAYSPIAGGFLTKSRKALEEGSEGGRFAATDNRLNNLYRGFYLKKALLEGLGRWEELAREQGISQAELAYRWVYYHSALDTAKGDFLILGASKPEQITQTVEGIKKGPLKPEVVKGVDEVWEIVKHEAITDNFQATEGKVSHLSKED